MERKHKSCGASSANPSDMCIEIWPVLMKRVSVYAHCCHCWRSNCHLCGQHLARSQLCMSNQASANTSTQQIQQVETQANGTNCFRMFNKLKALAWQRDSDLRLLRQKMASECEFPVELGSPIGTIGPIDPVPIAHVSWNDSELTSSASSGWSCLEIRWSEKEKR